MSSPSTFVKVAVVLVFAAALQLSSPANAEAGVRGKTFRAYVDEVNQITFTNEGVFLYLGGKAIVGFYVEMDLILTSQVFGIGFDSDYKFRTFTGSCEFSYFFSSSDLRDGGFQGSAR